MNTLTKSNGIVKGALILGIAMFLSKLIGFLYRIPMTMIIGDSGNAIYGVAFNIYALLLGVSAIGIPGAISKLVSECLATGATTDAKRVFRVALFYTGALSGLLSVGLFLGAEFIAVNLNGMAEITLPLRILSPTIFVASIMAVVRGYFQGMNTMVPTAISQVVEQFFNAIFSVLLAYYFARYSIPAAAAGSTMGTGIGAIAGFAILLLLYRKSESSACADSTSSLSTPSPVPSRFKSRREIIYKLLATVIPMLIITSVFSIFNVIDASMIAKYLPDSIDYLRSHQLIEMIPVTNASLLSTLDLKASLIGQYTTKYFTLINIPISLILIISVSAIPSISKSYTMGDTTGLTDKIYKILRIGFLLSIPAAFGLMMFARPIMHFMFSAHPDGGELVMHGALTIIFITIAQLSSSILQGMGKQYVPTLFAGIALAIKVVFNLILLNIPTLHIYSVIYSTLLAYCVFALLNLYYLKYKLKLDLPLVKLSLKPTVCATIMIMISVSLYHYLLTFLNAHITLFISIGVSMLIYVGMGFCIKMFDQDDLNYFSKVFSSRK